MPIVSQMTRCDRAGSACVLDNFLIELTEKMQLLGLWICQTFPVDETLGLGLPSGQDVAGYLGVTPLTLDQIKTGSEAAAVEAAGFDVRSPLWYYILKEAEVVGDGEKLGPVGSTIVAETFVGLLLADESSYLSKNRSWQPTLTLSDGTTKVDSLPLLIRYSQGE